MLSSAATQSVRNAYQLAAQYGHGAPGQEHLLLSLTGDPDAVAALIACGTDPRIIHREVNRLLPRIPERQTTDNPLERTVKRAERFKPEAPCDGACLLLALLVDRGATTAAILRRHGVTRDLVVEHMVQRDGAARRRGKTPRQALDASEPVKATAPVADGALASWCIDLNARAAAGRIDPVIGRDDAIARTIQIL
jgi:ATP-dependent Clp protease ATP-binding subunit ClpA